MSEIHQTRMLAETHSLKFTDHGNGHLQIEGHGILVNYWPLSKKQTAQVKGGEGVPHCSPWDAVQLCLKGVMYPRYGTLFTQSWAGTLKQKVIVVDETPTRYRIEAINRTRLAGNRRFINKGKTALVPKHAIKLKQAPSAECKGE